MYNGTPTLYFAARKTCRTFIITTYTSQYTRRYCRMVGQRWNLLPHNERVPFFILIITSTGMFFPSYNRHEILVLVAVCKVKIMIELTRTMPI